MFRIIGIVIAVGTVLLGAPEAAEAHRVGYHKYDAYGHRYHVDVDWLTGRIHLFDPDSASDPGVFDATVLAR